MPGGTIRAVLMPGRMPALAQFGGDLIGAIFQLRKGYPIVIQALSGLDLEFGRPL